MTKKRNAGDPDSTDPRYDDDDSAEQRPIKPGFTVERRVRRTPPPQAAGFATPDATELHAKAASLGGGRNDDESNAPARRPGRTPRAASDEPAAPDDTASLLAKFLPDRADAEGYPTNQAPRPPKRRRPPASAGDEPAAGSGASGGSRLVDLRPDRETDADPARPHVQVVVGPDGRRKAEKG